MNLKKKKPFNYLNAGIILLALAAYFYIFRRVIQFEDEVAQVMPFHSSSFSLQLISLLVITWAANLTCEVRKWQLLMRPYLKIHFTQGLKHVLAGSVTALLSPGRIAEPGGRMLLLPKPYRETALLTTSLGGLLQTIIIFFFGSIALVLSGQSTKWLSTANHLILYYALCGIVILIATLLILTKWSNHPFIKKIKGHLLHLKKLNLRLSAQIIAYTVIRYFIYLLQLYLWLILFNYPITASQLIILSPLYFFIITIIPSFLLADIGIRGTVSLFVFAPTNQYEVHLLAAIFFLWLFNVAVPTLIGSLILINHKKQKAPSV